MNAQILVYGRDAAVAGGKVGKIPEEHMLREERRDRTASAPEILGRRHEMLSRVFNSLASGAPKDWIHRLTAELRGMLEFDRLELVVYMGEDAEQVQSCFTGTKQTPPQDAPIGETLFGALHQHQLPLLIADCNSDESFMGLSQNLNNPRSAYRSFCGLPLNTQYRRVGVLGLASLEANSFTAEDVEFLNQIGSQMALAIDNWLTHKHVARLLYPPSKEGVDLVDHEGRASIPFEGMIGKSTALRKVLKQVEIVAPTKSNVIVFGETGTGKELIARAIHDLSPRRRNAFVTLNCAAIPTGLLESELFGHEKGAFTGAISRHLGRFESADRGTILLDEIGEIPLELQPKLLRVLQQREFERLGSGRTLRTDARLVAATNRDLRAMVDEQKFRADLFYRLNVFPIYVPPLRERPEDIPLLVRHFVRHFSKQMNRNIDSVPTETMEGLARYSWPGNIRELEHVMERAVILSPGPTLKVSLQDLFARTIPAENNGGHQTLEEVERAHILATLKATKWVLSGARGAATRLGLNRSTLQFYMKKFGIARPI